MAALGTGVGEFESWLNSRLESLELDKDVYGAYIMGVLREEETEDETIDALQDILSAFLEEGALDVCREITEHWKETASSREKVIHSDAEVQAIASMIEKQAQIVVKQKDVSEEEKKRKDALLAQYANVSDDEDEIAEDEETGKAHSVDSEKYVEDVLVHKKQQREQARELAQKKKDQDKMQREKDKLSKQERKDKEKKRTQKGERKR